MCFCRYATTAAFPRYLEPEACSEVTPHPSPAARVRLQTLNISRQGRLLHFSNIYSSLSYGGCHPLLAGGTKWASPSLIAAINKGKCWALSDGNLWCSENKSGTPFSLWKVDFVQFSPAGSLLSLLLLRLLKDTENQAYFAVLLQ